jgi:hypothetical protein
VPFLFEESIEVSKKLDLARAIYAFHRVSYYFVAVISENVARFFECIGEQLFPIALPESVEEALRQVQKARQQLQSGASAGDLHYQQMFGEMARAAFQMALVKYEDELAAVIRHYGAEEGYPVILPAMIGSFKSWPTRPPSPRASLKSVASMRLSRRISLFNTFSSTRSTSALSFCKPTSLSWNTPNPKTLRKYGNFWRIRILPVGRFSLWQKAIPSRLKSFLGVSGGFRPGRRRPDY